MNPLLRTALCVLLAATIATAKDNTPATYQQGTIIGWTTKNYSPNIFNRSGKHKVYELRAAGMIYQIDNCSTFQIGQVVPYRVTDNKIYIRANFTEAKCSIEGTRVDEGAKPESPSATH